MLIEQPIDGGDKLGLELAQLGDRQRSHELQCSGSPAGQTHMGSDFLRLDQRHVINEQAYDSFALTEVDARIVPDLWQLLGKTENPSAGLSGERCSLLLAAAFVFLGGFGMTAQLVIRRAAPC